jgi:aminoglycoside phosphotransferase (APT) family kinase protein
VLSARDVRRLTATDEPVSRLFLNEEFDTWAIGSDHIAKFPLAEEDAAKLEVEIAIHERLRRQLRDRIPAITLVGRLETPAFPFTVQERARGIQGQTVEGMTIAASPGLADDIGTLLGALHQIDRPEAETFGVGERPIRYTVPVLSSSTLDILRGPGGDELERFLTSLSPTPSERRTLCHTDLKGEHVFVDADRARVTSIIDWADTETCDPAQDYAGLVIWLGPGFTRAAIRESGDDDGSLADRAVWLARAGIVGYLDGMLTGGEQAPMALIEQQVRTAFGP